MVKDMGPLWAYSCFPFENANGKLLKLFHGTQNADFQIAQSVTLMQKLPKLQHMYLTTGSPEADLFKSMKGFRTCNENSLERNIYTVGAVSKVKLTPLQLRLVCEYLGKEPSHYQTFSKIRIRSDIFHSRIYQRSSKRNSFTTAYDSEEGSIDIGQIEIFAQVYVPCQRHVQMTKCSCSPAVNVAIVSKMKPQNAEGYRLSDDKLSGANVSFIKVMYPCNGRCICVVPLSKILCKCVYIEIEDRPNVVYACRRPNQCDKE